MGIKDAPSDSVQLLICYDMPISESTRTTALLWSPLRARLAMKPSRAAETCQESVEKQQKGLRFWLIFLSLCVTLFLSALEFSSVGNALPIIINELQGEFAWVGTSYALASTAFLPMSGGAAQSGNGLVIGSSTSLVTALTWGGARFPWSSVRVLVPLVIGIIGLAGWLIYEIRLASHPTVPRELVGNRTSVSGYVQVFIKSLVAISWIYYIPVYFQACKDASPVRASVDMFGLTIGVGPFIVCGGVSVTIFKVYRPQLWIGWMILAIVGAGAFSVTDATTPIAHPIGLVGSSGTGLLFTTTYFPVLSPLPVFQNAHALAFFPFIRSMGQIWGITFGSAILTNQLRTHLPSEFFSTFPGGVDLVYSVIHEIPMLAQPLKRFLISLFMADVPMHDYVDAQWTMTENSKEAEQVKEKEGLV